MKKKILLFTVIVILFIVARNCLSDNGNVVGNKIKLEKQNNPIEKEIKEKKTDTISVGFMKVKDSVLAMKELNFFENNLQKSFWTKFQQTNKYGRKYGSIEITFSQDKFESFVKKHKFKKTEKGTLMDYDGMKNGFHIYLDNNGTVPSSSGWVQKWKIKVQKEQKDTIYKIEKDIILNPR